MVAAHRYHRWYTTSVIVKLLVERAANEPVIRPHHKSRANARHPWSELSIFESDNLAVEDIIPEKFQSPLNAGLFPSV